MGESLSTQEAGDLVTTDPNTGGDVL